MLYKLNIGAVIALSAASYGVYFLLLHENFLNTSIDSIIAKAHDLAVKTHLLVLGLLPIYIAAMIFGAATLGVYLGDVLQQLLIRTTKNHYRD